MKIRLKYFIYPQFQSALLIANAVINMFLFTYLSVRVQLFFDSLIDAGKLAGFTEGHIYYKFILNQKEYLRSEFLIALLISLILTSVLTLWLSHRLAGPLVRLKNHMKSMAADGVYREIKFRKNDYFQDLPDSINQAYKRISKHDSK